MSTLNEALKETLKAQDVLKDAVLDQLSEVQQCLSEAPKAADRERLIAKRHQLMDKFDALQVQGIVILGVTSQQDLAIIHEASQRIKDFVYNTKKVEKTIGVITAVLVFVGAALTGKPKGISDAAIALYKAMNKKIDEEKDKGDKAAVLMAPLSLKGSKTPKPATQKTTVKKSPN